MQTKTKLALEQPQQGVSDEVLEILMVAAAGSRQNKRRHNDEDPFADVDKDTKKRRQKDTKPSNKEKESADSSNKGKAPSKSSKYDKNVNAEELVQDAAMDVEESVKDDVVNTEEPTKVDVVPKQDNSKWFKQYVIERLETPDPE
ncbi:hypothetical protein Tco_0248461 [Tanacetum coccineum]